MHLSEVSLVIDENIHPELIALLRSRGFDCYSIREEKLKGLSDRVILQLAMKDKRAVLTQDADFGKLVYTEAMDFHGIIYLRPGHFAPQFHAETLNALLSDNPVVLLPFIIVAEHKGQSIQIRIRNQIG